VVYLALCWSLTLSQSFSILCIEVKNGVNRFGIIDWSEGEEIAEQNDLAKNNKHRITLMNHFFNKKVNYNKFN